MPTAVKKRSTRATEPENSTLLAVCSNADDLRSLRDILEPDHWDVQYASTCDEALTLMKHGNQLWSPANPNYRTVPGRNYSISLHTFPIRPP